MNLGGAKVKAGLCSTLYTGHGRELAGKACVHYGRGTNLVDYWEGIFSPDNDVVHVRLTTFASEVLQCFVDTTLRCSVGNRQKRAQQCRQKVCTRHECHATSGQQLRSNVCARQELRPKQESQLVLGVWLCSCVY